MRRIATWLHRYVGLALAVFLLISSLTGTAVVFSKSLDIALNPDLLLVEPQQERASLDIMLDRVRQVAPAEVPGIVFIPGAPDRAFEVWFQGEEHLRAYVNPYTGEVLGVREATSSLMGFLVDLHIHLLSGETGEAVMGWAGVGAVVLAALGLYLWWPKRGRFKQSLSVKWRAAPVRVWLDVHKTGGTVAAAFIILTAATGSSLALYDVITEPALVALTGEGTQRPAPLSRAAGVGAEKASLASMLAKAESLYPDGRITRISLPAGPEGAVMIRMRLPDEIHQFGRSFLWFDQYGGRLLRADMLPAANRATQIQAWLYPLHTGVYGGLLTRWLQVLVGLVLAMLSLSGVWLWWKGYSARQFARRK